MTQNELAEALYVSRAAVSKWESGRGYPNIDSLRKMAEVFSVSVDGLLSPSELLTVVEEQTRRGKERLCDLVFGLIDVAAMLFWLLPLFRQSVDGKIAAVSLLDLAGKLRVFYYAVFALLPLLGVLSLAWQNAAFVRTKRTLSLLAGILGVLLLVIGMHPYAATLLLSFLAVKVILLVGCR